MILLGATAIEDKLQDGVPEAISTLLNVSTSNLEQALDVNQFLTPPLTAGRPQNVGVDRRQDGNRHQYWLFVLPAEQ